MTADVTAVIEAEITNLDAAISEMTARKLSLIQCRTLLTAPIQPVPPQDDAVEPIQPVPPQKRTRPTIKPVKPRKGERKTLRANITPEDIEMIRRGAKDGFAHADIAGWMDGRVSRSTIGNIINRRGCYADM